MSLPIDDTSQQVFGQHTVHGNRMFYRTSLSTAFVNPAPVLPGHTLIIPNRRAPRLIDLTGEEMQDLWQVAAKTAKMIIANYQSINQSINEAYEPSFTYAIQDGVDAGQSVKHVHIHVLPRFKGDFQRNDDVYGILENNENKVDQCQSSEQSINQSNQSINQSNVDPPKTAHVDTTRVWLTEGQQVEKATQYRDWIAKIKD